MSQLTTEQAALVERHRLDAFKFIFHSKPKAQFDLSDDDAMDMAHDAVLAAARAYKPGGTATFKTYLYATCWGVVRGLNRVSERSRFHASLVSLDTPLPSVSNGPGRFVHDMVRDADPDPETAAMQSETAREMAAVLESLKPRTADVFIRRVMLDEPAGEVAAMYGVCHARISQMVADARRHLQKKVML